MPSHLDCRNRLLGRWFRLPLSAPLVTTVLIAVMTVAPESLRAEVDPLFSSVQPADALDGIVCCPNEPAPILASINTITVRTAANNPIENAAVTIILHPDFVGCDGNDTFSGTTNAGGEVILTIVGGGCVRDTPLAALVKVNGVTIRAYRNVKSPDYDGSSADLVVNLADLIPFSNEFLDVDPAECGDMDNNGDTDLGDLIVFAAPFSNGNYCDP